MSCPCRLTKAEVLEVAEKHGIPLMGGKCQNPRADGAEGVCGRALGAHESSQSNAIIASTAVRPRPMPSLRNPDRNTLAYLTRGFPGICETADKFKTWFTNTRTAAKEGRLGEGLKFPIYETDLHFDGWDLFKRRFCDVVPAGEERCETLVSLLEGFAIIPAETTTDSAEMTVNGVIDALLSVLCCALLTVRERNAKIATSANDRPDYSLKLAFVGEDKLLSNYTKGRLRHDPEVDLLSVTPFDDWDEEYGKNVPFILGYTALGSADGADFQLGLIDRSTRSFKPLHPALNLSAAANRAEAAECVLLLRPGLSFISNEIEHTRVTPTVDYHRRHQYPPCDVSVMRRVRAGKRVVEKVWEYADVHAANEFQLRMTAIFDAINDLLPFKVLPPGFKKKSGEERTVKAFFVPFGGPCSITSVLDAVNCVSDIVETLRVLRAVGVVHHDIRLSNIVAVELKGRTRYVLIDFDEAQSVGPDGTWEAVRWGSLHPSTHHPASFAQHGPEVDIWSVGHLLRDWSQELVCQKMARVGSLIEDNASTLSLEEVQVLIDSLGDP